MENKSNSLNRIKRHQREKVLRFSIRKYSFGAASVAIAALMFLGARVVSADTVSGSSSQSTAGVVQPDDKGDSPVGIKEPTENKSEVVNNALENKETALVENGSNTVDKSQLRTVVEELNSLLSTKLNLDNSVLSSVKERVQRAQALLDKADAVQKDINELKELLSADLATLSNAVKESSEVRESNTGTEAEKPVIQPSSEVRASEENQTVSAKKDSLKVSVDQLKVAISEVPEHDTTKEVLEKANEVMVLAQGVLQNTTVSLTDVEQMNKLVKRMFISVKNATTRLNSGSRDPRNGQRMRQGTGERAATVSSTWTNQDNQLIYQRFRATDGNGTVRNDDRRFTENKVDMTARIEMNGGVKYVVYDIFFNNDGQSMVALSKQQAYRFILQPKILDLISSGRNEGAYKSDTISDLYFEIYRRNNQNEGGTLSQNPEKFHRERIWNLNFLENDKSTNGFIYHNTLGVRATGDHYKDMKDIFKGNRYDEYLQKAVKLEGVHRKYSYGLGVITNDPTAAVHMHLKAKLKSGVTDEEVRQAFTIAVATTHGETTNQSYVFGSGKETSERVEPTVKQSTKYPISGKEVTKKVDEPLGNLDRPVDAGFVTRNDNFPADIQWSWPDGKPNTTKAGVFHYKVKAQYSDNTSNTTDVTLKVRPKQPVIDPNSVNEKAGKTEQTVTVNVGNGVPKDSIVTLYSGTTVIGTGKTTGTTATIKVSKALPSTAITARTTVTTNGTVDSEPSALVTPTPERDTQPPTVKMINPINNRESVLGSSENNSPVVDVFRGATLDIPLKMHDNNPNGKINIKHVSGLPKGVNLNNGNTLTTNSGSETNPATATISGRVATDAHLGTNVVTLKVSDDATGNVDRGNNKEVKFNIRTYDVEANSTRVTVEKGTTLSEQDAKAAVSKVVGSEDLPNGTTYEWVDSRGNKQTPTPNTAGVNNYRVKVTLPGSGSGTNILNGSSKIVDVPVNVRPETPVVDTPLRAHKTMKIDTVPSTATRLTGTGIPGATIKVKVAGRELPNTVTVGQNGRWELQLTKGLNSNQTNQRQLVPSDPVVVTQIVGGVESSEKSVPVSLGETSIQPSVEGGTTVYAGAKNLVVKAPHDAGMIYVSYRDKATGAEHEIGLKRENIDSPWVSNKSNLGVVTGTTKDAFTNTITIKMNESIAEGTAKAVSNISEGNYSSAVDWKTIPVSNQAPTITAGSQGSTVTVEHGAPVTLKNLVTARDVEDDSQITRGNGVNIEVISVNDSTTTKEINTNQPGVYRVKYKAVDSQGKESGEVVVTVNVRPETPVVDTPLRAHKTMKIDTV
uniref:YSIRK-type signal peptide-containing protein n=1 Tax=Streptococcus mitis TaxID=28037 RepID=UPI0021B7DB5E